MSIDRRVDKGDAAHTYNGILLSHEKENRPTDFKNKLMVPRGKDGGKDSQGVWDGHGHTAGFNMENQQRPAGQPREVSSILCNNLMVIQWMWGRDSHGAWDARGHTAVFNMENQQGPVVQPREVCSILCNNLMVPRGKGWGRDSQGVWDGHGHTAVFNMENQQGPAGQHGEICSMSRGSRDGRGVWGRMDTHTCTAESLHYSPEAIPQYKIKLKIHKNKKKAHIRLQFESRWREMHLAPWSQKTLQRIEQNF